MRKSDEQPLKSWTEPPEATAQRPLILHHLLYQPLFIEDEWGRRLNWPLIAVILTFIVVEMRPWRWLRGEFELDGQVIVALLALLAAYLVSRLNLQKWLLKDLKRTKGKAPEEWNKITLYRTGLQIGGIFLSWRRIRAYRLCNLPEHNGLRGIEMRVQPSYAGRPVIFVGFDRTVDERDVRRILGDHHPMGNSENVGFV